MQCKAKSENLAHILRYQIWAVTTGPPSKPEFGLPPYGPPWYSVLSSHPWGYLFGITPTLKEEVIVEVKEFFCTGEMAAGINETMIVLIPKVDNPELVSHFRPISLCNVIYKVLSKCLVNRLRPMLDDIISEAQSAFVPGRLITDNALLAFECLHYIQQEKHPGRSFCAYKLDLSKAYDRVDWVFLEQVMLKLGDRKSVV